MLQNSPLLALETLEEFFVETANVMLDKFGAIPTRITLPPGLYDQIDLALGWRRLRHDDADTIRLHTRGGIIEICEDANG